MHDLQGLTFELAGANGVARSVAGAKWAAGPAPAGQRDTPLVLSLSEGLGRNLRTLPAVFHICELPSWLEAENSCLEAVIFVEGPRNSILLEGK